MKQPKDLPLILECIRSSENWRDNTYKVLWENCLKQYRSKHRVEPEGSHVFVPYTFMQVETIKSRVSESLFASRPYVALLPRGNEDVNKAKAVQMLLDWQFNDRMNIPGLFSEDVLSDATIFGTCVTFTGWLKKTRSVKRRVKVQQPLIGDDGMPFTDEMGMPISIEVNDVQEYDTPVYDDPLVQKVDIFDFYTDPMSTNIQDARYCGHREWLTKAAIKDFEKTAGWSVNWKNLQSDGVAKGGKVIRTEAMGNSLSLDVQETPDNKDLYLVHHYWEDDRHVVIINEDECVLDEPNPFWHGMKPYDKCCYIPLSNEFYGMGIPEVLKDLQDELNTSRNQRIDWNSMALRRMWKLRKGCGIMPKDLIWRQNGVIQVDEMDDLMEINVQEMPASAFTNEDVIKKDMRDATGCHDIIMGLTTTADETATTTMTKDNNASIRFKYFIESVVREMLIPIAQKCMALNQQFMEEERVIRVLDNPQFQDVIFNITPDDLINVYDMSYVGTSVEPVANKEAYKQNMLQVYNLAMANPLVQQDPNSMAELLRELLVANDVKDIDAKMPKMQQQQPMMPQGVDMNRVKELVAQKLQQGGMA